MITRLNTAAKPQGNGNIRCVLLTLIFIAIATVLVAAVSSTRF